MKAQNIKLFQEISLVNIFIHFPQAIRIYKTSWHLTKAGGGSYGSLARPGSSCFTHFPPNCQEQLEVRLASKATAGWLSGKRSIYSNDRVKGWKVGLLDQMIWEDFSNPGDTVRAQRVKGLLLQQKHYCQLSNKNSNQPSKLVIDLVLINRMHMRDDTFAPPKK